MTRTILAVALMSALAGCVNLAPDYERPAAPVTGQWQNGAAYDAAKLGNGTPLSQIGWQDYFTDARLKKVVELALANNRDMRVTVLNIEKARAQYQIQRASLFPAVNATAGETAQRYAKELSSKGYDYVGRQYSLAVGFSAYELDFFGRVRNLKDSMLEQYLATDEAQRTAKISLVAEVANDWLTLAADQERLRLAKETFKSQQASYDLIKRSVDVGVNSAVELNQSRTSVESARADVARYTASVAQDVNALTLVVGTGVPADLMPDQLADATAPLAEIPAGIPADVLQDRPDVLQAERLLRAANASIGAARAAFFPRITLTASGGVGSTRLNDLFDTGSGTWTFIPQITLPIFNAGSNQASLDSAKVDRDIKVAQYEKAIQSAFREVSDALAQRGTLGEQLDAVQALAKTSGESYRLSELRFNKGVDSYLNVLDSQRTFYSAQQTLITTRLARQTNQVTLYKVLGGGWQDTSTK